MHSRNLAKTQRHEHDRDLDIRASQRRDEAREQAERHRFQMEMMLDRVTQIPTLFERHSQVYHDLRKYIIAAISLPSKLIACRSITRLKITYFISVTRRTGKIDYN